MAQCVVLVGGGLGSFMGKVHRQAIEKAGNLKRQLQNLPRYRRFHRNRPTCFAKIGAILVGRHRRCRRFNEVLQLPLKITCGAFGSTRQSSFDCQDVLEFITGYQITEVCANARSCVPGRLI